MAEADLSGPAAAVEHPLVPADEAILIESDEELAGVIDSIRAAGRFAFDTEFIGEETYYPQLCLLQLATTEHVWLVDSLCDIDLDPIWRIIADPELITLVHAGQQDLEPVVRVIDAEPANILDTQIAAAFTARPYPIGLRGVVEECIGLRLGKGLTFTRWDQRPLSGAHRRYAADDVRYLMAVAQQLEEELAGASLLDAARAACAEATRASCYRFDANARATRLMGNRTLDKRATEILRRLVVLRDDVARRENRPPRGVLRDEIVVRIAKSAPKNVNALDGIKGMPWPIVESVGEEIIAIVADVKAQPKSELPEAGPPEESTAERFAIDALYSAAAAHCAAQGIDPSIATNRRDIARWYLMRTGRWDGAGAHALDSGWRADVLGQWLTEFFGGNERLHLGWSDGLRQNGAD